MSRLWDTDRRGSTPVGDPRADRELIAQVRAGNLGAFEALFQRHRGSAARLAHQLADSHASADDLVAEAFARVLRALREGRGPDLAFRPYLLTTLRHAGYDASARGGRERPAADLTGLEPAPAPAADPAVAAFERSAAARAFRSLPERWQVVLWHTAVEGERPAAVAPILGMSANGVAALAHRAREGLRQAYLQVHLAGDMPAGCRVTREHLAGYVRGKLSAREDRRVREHLDGCSRCAAIYLELVAVNSELPTVLAPVVLGAAAAGYLHVTGGAVATVQVGTTVGGLARWLNRVARQPVRAVGVAVAAVVVVGGLAFAATQLGSTPPLAAGRGGYPSTGASAAAPAPPGVPGVPTGRAPAAAPTLPGAVPPPAPPSVAPPAPPARRVEPSPRPAPPAARPTSPAPRPSPPPAPPPAPAPSPSRPAPAPPLPAPSPAPPPITPLPPAPPAHPAPPQPVPPAHPTPPRPVPPARPTPPRPLLLTAMPQQVSGTADVTFTARGQSPGATSGQRVLLVVSPSAQIHLGVVGSEGLTCRAWPPHRVVRCTQPATADEATLRLRIAAHGHAAGEVVVVVRDGGGSDATTLPVRARRPKPRVAGPAVALPGTWWDRRAIGS